MNKVQKMLKIKNGYLNLQIGYDAAIYQLKLLGLSEKQADDYILPVITK